MVVGNAPEAVDLVVIGTGPGGYTAALHAASLGREVTLVERGGEQAVGGVCLHSGCIPSKSLIEAAGIYHRSHSSAHMGITVDNACFNMTAFLDFKRGVVDQLAGGVAQKLSSAGVKIVTGNALFTDSKTLVVATIDGQAKFLQFRDCIIATGSSPLSLPGFTFGDTVLDAEAALELQEVPQSIAIVGAGYIGLEIGCALAKLGSVVTVVEAEPRILPAMEAGPDIILRRKMEQLGIQFKCGCKASDYTDGVLKLVDSNQAEFRIEAEYVLLAVGRKPNTADLELDAAGIAVQADGLLAVDADRRISQHIAAIGDITPGPALAHKAMAEAVVAVDALCGESTAFEPQAVPLIVFTDPEIAMAGSSLQRALSDEVKAVSAKLPLRASGRAATMAESDGYIELVFVEVDRTLLGATIVAPHASELVAEICVAIEMGASVDDLALTIHPHPTLSELVMDTALKKVH
ncbi:dihydrolipoyl dehydrogenase [Chromatiales bacterium (ex Bugula neritina AB1)]|nr:dihydrolipoyl dehydrogenase [Chromatiales bacterium (ex Bugula neritina AB1)]